ncbi:MAG: VWA domain-containing protein [Candidatus Kapaibacterium sp.]|nr:VWA domain-containing protein [Candidatus Kapabacteria bacterium]
MKFANPEYLYLLLLLPLFILWYIYKERRQNLGFKLSSISGMNTGKSLRIYLRHSIIVFRLILMGALIIALARPQTSSTMETISSEGIDIVISLDVSTSMLAEDFKPNRIESAKNQALDFVDKRTDDRMGFVVFGAESFTQCPVTVDHNVLKNLIKDVRSGMLEDGTAIGMGIATAVTRLKDSKAKSKVIILLTDGVNNTGIIAPETAAEIAATYGIKIYTIGVGTRGLAPYPVQTPFGTQYRNVEVEIDDNLLKKIAEMTGGMYFRATNNKGLNEIYSEIDKLEKTQIDVAVFSKKKEEFLPFAIIGLAFLLIEILSRYLFFRTLP